jgi:hypothetical protein
VISAQPLVEFKYGVEHGFKSYGHVDGWNAENTSQMLQGSDNYWMLGIMALPK